MADERQINTVAEPQAAEPPPQNTSAVRDKRVVPAGVVPRQAQGYVVAGLAVLILMAVMFSKNHAKPAAKDTAPAPLAASTDMNQQKIQELEQDLSADQRQSQQQAQGQRQNGLPMAAGATAAPGALPPGTASGASPRPRSGKRYATWCPTCIREMLRRDLYAGKVIWNSSRFVKVPGTNKRVRRARPESEWRIVPHPELQIIDDELWQRVKERQDKLQAMYGVRKGGGILIPRSATSPYLLSGLLKCGSCGANLIIISGYDSSGHHPRYGCSQHFNRGACSNSLTVRRDWIEGRLLDELQNYVLQRDAVEYVLDEFGNQMKNAFANPR